MIVTLCGSISFYNRMLDIKELLEAKGVKVLMPTKAEGFDYENCTVEQAKENKLKHDFISEHFIKIKEGNAILVINENKKGIENYIGANTFLEIGVAYFLKKQIYILNSLPDQEYLLAEIEAMQPILLNHDLDLLYSKS